MLSRSVLSVGLTLIVYFFSTLAWGSSSPLKLLIPADVLDDYHLFLGKRKPEQIYEFKGVNSRRDVVEVVLLLQALQKGGISQPVEFIPVSSYQRILRQIRLGHALMAATTSWEVDLGEVPDDIWISSPLIREGEFEAGLYTVPGNATAISARSTKDVRGLTAVSNSGWKVDWATLSSLKLRRLDSTVQWLSMVKMVSINRVDFLLAPFQASSDLSLTVEGIRLVPIPNIKIALQGSRHYGLSRRYPGAIEIRKALDKGLLILRKQGTIELAYQQSGFFNLSVKDWKQIE